MSSKSFKILLIDDDPDDVEELKKHFRSIDSPWGVNLSHINEPTKALQELSENPYDIIITEYDFGDLTGLDLIEEINELDWNKPIIMLTDEGNEEIAARALRLEATDYRIKDNLSPSTLKHSIQRALKKYLKSTRQQKQQRKLQQEAGQDNVTGLDNRQQLREKIQQAIKNAKNNNTELCLFMLALKNFDQINAIHGQETGDEILKRIGKFISNNVRDQDHAGRYQGVEFCTAMPATDKEQATMLAKRFINQFETKLANIEDEYNISVGYGGTIVERKAGENEIDDLMKRAVEKLYQAKIDVNENELKVS